MDILQFTSQSPKIPRYICGLNALAEKHGITTSVDFGPYDGDSQIRLWATWKGTCQQLGSLGLVASHRLGYLMWFSGDGQPRKSMLTVPSSEPPWGNPLLMGEIEISATLFRWDIDFGPTDFSVETRNDLEVITYPDQVFLHGTAEGLIASGIDRARLPLGQRTSKSKWHGYQPDSSKWRCRRLPDSTFLYCFETEAAFQRRTRDEQPKQCHSPKPSAARHLRLIVDNTSEESRS